MKSANPFELSTVNGRKATKEGIARSNLPASLKAVLIGALDAGRFPPLANTSKGRPTDQVWKQVKKSIEGRLIDLNAPRGEQTKEIKRLAVERNISEAAMRDRIFRPNRKR